MGTCGVTGTTGYVGSQLARILGERGWAIQTLGRSGCDVRFDLAEQVSPSDLSGLEALVHLSYDFSCRSWEETRRINVEGSRRLFEAARTAGVQQLVCISTIAAFPGTRSHYGRAKLDIEHAALGLRATVIRPGLVWGEDGGAMFGALAAAVTKLPIVPLPAPARLPMVMAHQDDLGQLVARILERNVAAEGQLVVAGADQTVFFIDLLRGLAAARGRQPRFLHVPWRLAWLGLRTLERAGVDPPFRSDSLVSLVSVDPDPFGRATMTSGQLGVSFRQYPAT
jgi:nucleoside-diphosphate-sugar epimerase